MEITTIKISKELLQILVDSNAITTDDFELKSVSDNSFDYSRDETWKELNKKAGKAYKKVKDREYEIRQK